MANFAHYFNSRFAGCQLLAEAFDQHRDRDVRIYRLPGQMECVGVSDGIDRWVAPVTPDIFSVNIHQLMRDLHDGKQISLPVRAGKAQEPSKRARRRLITETEASPPEADPEPVLRRPRASLAPTPTKRRALLN